MGDKRAMGTSGPYRSLALNEPIFEKWPGSSLDEMDLLEQRLADCGNDFSVVCTGGGRMVCADDEDADTDTLSSTLVGFGGSTAADRSLSVR